MTRKPTLRALLAGALIGLLAATSAQAAVRWADPAPLGAGQRGSLDLVFEDTQPDGPVDPPVVDELTFLGAPSPQSSTSIINGTRSDTFVLSFPVRAEREGSITVPSFQVETADGTEIVPALTVDVGAAMIPSSRRGGTAAPVGDVVVARMTPSNMTPYAGEVFEVGVIVGLTGGTRGEVVGTPSWNNPGVTAEAWSDGQQVSTETGPGVRFHTRAVAPQTGRIEIAPVEQEVNVEIGRQRVDPFGDVDDAFESLHRFGGADLFGSVFSRAQTANATVRSNSAQIDVQPLPQPAPEGFSGAVGEFTMSSNLAPASFKTGEPITWTLTLEGIGNWPSVALPGRAIPNHFRTLQPKQKKDFADGELFSGALHEDLVLIANQPGDYQLEPVRFVYFDPARGEYQTIEARPPALHITGAPIAAPSTSMAPAVAAPAAPASADAAAATASAAVADAPPMGNPLSGNASGHVPMPVRSLLLLAAAPFALLLLYWIGLAIRRARLADPRRAERQARRQLAAAVRRVRDAATTEERIAALLAWQHASVLALRLDLAAPTAQQLPDQRWMDVWAGSERGLYGREHELPINWCERALALCTRNRRPRFNLLRAFTTRHRHLVPKAATALLLIALAAIPARAADQVEPDTGADAAHAQLLDRAKQAPTDWTARYNLGRAAAEQGDAPRALGETLAAFVQAPRNADVRANATAFAARAPGLDADVASLIARPGLSGLAAPAAWQMLIIAAAVVACVGAALALHRRYTGGSVWDRTAWAIAIVGLVIGAAAIVGLRGYGPLTDPRAALIAGQPALRSVPTDAEAAPAEAALPAGTLVVMERAFLGWVKVELRDGASGWIRHGDVVPLYAAPSA